MGTHGGNGYDLAAFDGTSDRVSMPRATVTAGESRQQLYSGGIAAADWISADIYPTLATTAPIG